MFNKNNPLRQSADGGQNSNQSHDRFYFGIFLGVVIGAGVYWLLTSEKGKKIIKTLKSSEEDWAKKTKELLAEAQVTEMVDEDEEGEVRPRKEFPRPFSPLPKRRFFRIKR